jgi:hypothetical protein
MNVYGVCVCVACTDEMKRNFYSQII